VWHLGAGNVAGIAREAHRRRVGRGLGWLLARDLLALRFLALALHARLLIVLTATGLGQNAALLNLFVETAQGTLEAFVFTHTDFCQSGNHLLKGSDPQFRFDSAHLRARSNRPRTGLAQCSPMAVRASTGE
jgi:hypothetical protein